MLKEQFIIYQKLYNHIARFMWEMRIWRLGVISLTINIDKVSRDFSSFTIHKDNFSLIYSRLHYFK